MKGGPCLHGAERLFKVNPFDFEADMIEGEMSLWQETDQCKHPKLLFSLFLHQGLRLRCNFFKCHFGRQQTEKA